MNKWTTLTLAAVTAGAIGLVGCDPIEPAPEGVEEQIELDQTGGEEAVEPAPEGIERQVERDKIGGEGPVTDKEVPEPHAVDGYDADAAN